MVQKLLKYIHALLQFYTDLFLFWIENGFSNTFRLLWAFVSKQEIIRIDYETKKAKEKLTLFFNAETYHRITLFHVLHSYKQMEKLLAAVPSHDCRYILDLGANCGHFSVVAAEKFPQATIYAFEPSPSLHPILNKNIAGRNIKLVPKAVSDTVGSTKFHINLAGQQTNSILVESVEVFNKKYETIEVPLTTLDVFAAENQIQEIAILKIDCQGVESMILKGGEKILQHTNYLILEVTFLDKDVQGLLNYVLQYFPYYQVVNAVMLGGDLVFSKKPFE
jgi:FkbM family methyltransferase